MRPLLLKLAGVVLGGVFLAAVLAPFFAPYPAHQQFRQHANRPPPSLYWLDPKAPSMVGPFFFDDEGTRYRIRFFVDGEPYRFLGLNFRTHLYGTDDIEVPVFLLGTDSLGRDLLSRVLSGLRFSAAAGLVGILISLFLGLALGAPAGYLGGWLDGLAMRTCDLFLSLPGLFLVLGLRALFSLDLSSTGMFWLMVLIFGLIGWASIARVVRGQVISIKHREHVLAARLIGASHARILIRHILPLTTNVLMVQATFFLPVFIVGEITLSFLGVGVQEPAVSLGTLLRGAASLQAVTLYPWQMVPAAIIFILVFAFNLVGDELRVHGRVREQWW